MNYLGSGITGIIFIRGRFWITPMEREPTRSSDERDHSGEAYHRGFLLLQEFFLATDLDLRSIRGLAQRIKAGFDKIGPFIQQTTSEVCPRCPDVCCISKHGFFNYEDLVYQFALGLKPPQVDFGRNDFDPCQFLTANGCSIERSLRPSGCNWYFCDALLEVIEQRPDYHEFDDAMRDLAELWMKMLEEFSRISPLRPA
jgi:hypothetical protein